MRFMVVDTNVLIGHGQVSHKNYRIIDTEDPSDPSKYGVHPTREEAQRICDQLNLDNPFTTEGEPEWQ